MHSADVFQSSGKQIFWHKNAKYFGKVTTYWNKEIR